MKRIIRLTESDLARIVRRVINEQYDDNWASALQNIVADVNSKLPANSARLIANQPNITKQPDGTEQINASIGIDMKNLGIGGSGILFRFGILKMKDGVVQATSVTLQNPIGEKQVGRAQKTLDLQTKKLKYPVSPDFNYTPIYEIAKALETSGNPKLTILGNALYGRKSRNTKTNEVTDFSQIPGIILTGINSVKKSIQAFIPVNA
jgi:hypothetical protein